MYIYVYIYVHICIYIYSSPATNSTASLTWSYLKLSCFLTLFADQCWCDFTRTSIYGKYSGLTKITAHLNYISHCKTASSTISSSRWTYPVFIINTRQY